MMKKRWILLVCYILVVLLPYLIVTFFVDKDGLGLEPYDEQQENEEDIKNQTIKLYMTESDKVIDISCFDYICAVVSGEMQANYEPEALKAQAVAAFTYMVNRMNYVLDNPESDIGHKGAYVCDDYNHCLAYLPKDEAEQRWGEAWFNKYYSNIENAVGEVLGKVITYDGQPINAVFHSISNGNTESAKEVWGSDIAYLQSVASEQDNSAAGYKSTVSFTHDEFKEIVENDMGITLPDDPAAWIGQPQKSSAGTVSKINIGGTEVEGTYVRKMLSLRSASFDVENKSENIIFTVYGYGHDVGMSQYGANEMAKEGKNYQEILLHYYKDTKIEDFKF